MKILILSDIHGNRSAFRAVLDAASRQPDIGACILLGDLIDYGMHSNEVIQMASSLPWPVLCNLRGNHEAAIRQEDYSRFSSERGRESAGYTRSILTRESLAYMEREMDPGGKKEFLYAGRRCLAIHGSLSDEYWKSISPTGPLTGYENYDYVFSGHSHLPHMMEKHYSESGPHSHPEAPKSVCIGPTGEKNAVSVEKLSADTEGEVYRRLAGKKTVFINPGSVGQPRNRNPMAQFAILDMETEQLSFEKTAYDIAAEQAAFQGQVDDFYRERLKWGI